jgi:hypothetical protein
VGEREENETSIGSIQLVHTNMLCRRPSSSSISDRRDDETTELRRRISTLAKPARTLDPGSGSSSAWAPSLSSSSSTGNRGRDLRRRSVIVGVSSNDERGLSTGGSCDDSCFIGAGKGSGFRIFLQVRKNKIRQRADKVRCRTRTC